MALLREGGRRLASVHLRNSQQGIWTEDLGEGDLNHADFARFLRGIGFDGFLVVELAYDKETRITRPITRSLEMSRAYVEKVFGVKA
jgi:inosose dehydratase